MLSGFLLTALSLAARLPAVLPDPLATLSGFTARLSGILLTALSRTLPGWSAVRAALLLLLSLSVCLLVHHFLHGHHCRKHAFDPKG